MHTFFGGDHHTIISLVCIPIRYPHISTTYHSYSSSKIPSVSGIQTKETHRMNDRFLAPPENLDFQLQDKWSLLSIWGPKDWSLSIMLHHRGYHNLMKLAAKSMVKY